MSLNLVFCFSILSNGKTEKMVFCKDIIISFFKYAKINKILKFYVFLSFPFLSLKLFKIFFLKKKKKFY